MIFSYWLLFLVFSGYLLLYSFERDMNSSLVLEAETNSKMNNSTSFNESIKNNSALIFLSISSCKNDIIYKSLSSNLIIYVEESLKLFLIIQVFYK
jgi:hypothetical protein